MGLRLNLTAEQEKAFQGFLEGPQGDYRELTNNCTDPAENGLEQLKFGLGVNVRPLGFANALIGAGLVGGVTTYPQTREATGKTAPWATSK